MTKQFTLQDYVGIAKRRKWLLIIPPFICALVAVAVTFVLQPKFTSQTLVLVESQQVADSLVKPAITEDLNQRLSTMKQQILSRSRLEPIMQKFGLYKSQMKQVSIEDLVEQMRTQIIVTPIRGSNDSTPGFYISFTAQDPNLAQQVCAEITSLFMEQNLKLREERSVGTTDFLATQLQQSKQNLDAQDAKLASFERKYTGQLPGEEAVNVNMLTSLKSQLDAVTEALNRAQQDKLYTESLMAQHSISRAATPDGGESLTALQLDEQLTRLRAQLAVLEARYTPEHPDVIKTREMIAREEKGLQNSIQQPGTSLEKAEARPVIIDSPDIQRLRDNIHLLDQTVREKSAEQARLLRTIKQYESRIELTPAVKQQYKQLTRDYQTAQAFYEDILRKKSQSEMSTDLERRQEGEQFRVVDPANLPEKPTFPNRPVFLGMGFGLGLGFGAGLAFLLEWSASAIRGQSDVEFYLKMPVLASIPEIQSVQQIAKGSLGNKWRWRKDPFGVPRADVIPQESVLGQR